MNALLEEIQGRADSRNLEALARVFVFHVPDSWIEYSEIKKFWQLVIHRSKHLSDEAAIQRNWQARYTLCGFDPPEGFNKEVWRKWLRRRGFSTIGGIHEVQ